MVTQLKSTTIQTQNCRLKLWAQKNGFCFFFFWGPELLGVKLLSISKNLQSTVLFSIQFMSKKKNAKHNFLVVLTNLMTKFQKTKHYFEETHCQEQF